MRYRISRALLLAALQSVALAQTPLTWDDDCTNGGFDLGILPQLSTHLISTSGQGNDFGCDPACPPPCAGCSGYGTSGSDVVATFKVSISGLWRFSTCSTEGWLDSSLALREGGACPGVQCLEQDDASCSSCFYPRKAALSATLVAGTTYYLIVDSYSSGGLAELQIGGPCDSSADCSDGIFCNGLESCTSGSCMSGSPCSGVTPICDEVAEVCLPCTADPAICADNGVFCDGPGTCLPSGECAQGGNPCSVIQSCNELIDICVDPDPSIAWRTGGTISSGSFIPSCLQPCPYGRRGDDIQLSPHAGRELISYEVVIYCRSVIDNPACAFLGLGQPFTFSTELWSVEPKTCLPFAPIPGTECTQTFHSQIHCEFWTLCAPNGGLPTGVLLPRDQDGVSCGVDFFVMVSSPNDTVGPGIGAAVEIGGPAASDDLGGSAMVGEECDPLSGLPLGTFYYFEPSTPSHLNFRRARINTVSEGPCCNPQDGTCERLGAESCAAQGGTWLGPDEINHPRICNDSDSDSDGTRDECDLCDNNPMKTSPGQCGCAIADTDADDDSTADCLDGCPLDSGKIAPGICGCGMPDTDSDGDETPDCLDSCSQDPEKLQPGICGCGFAETGDTDGDTVADCVDQCPGADDGKFAPLCSEAIPAASQWTMICLTLTLLILAKLRFGVRPCGVW